MNELDNRIRTLFEKSSRVLIASHVRPDGDAIGSLLALGLALQDTGKQVQMVLTDGVPDSFHHLPGSEQIVTRRSGDYDRYIVVDCADVKRTGGALDGHKPDLVIDHHASTEPYGTLNLVEPEMVATASVMTRHMPAWGLTITAPIAANLLTGLITDTLGFRTTNVNPEVFRQTADLLELGVDLSTLYFHSLVRRTLPGAKYWGAGLTSLEYADRIVWATLTLADRKASGYTGNDDADLINVVSAIDDADISIMFVEQIGNRVKISWRTRNPDINLASIAVTFGGGGHRAAAGADVDGTLSDVRDRVLKATRNHLKKWNSR
jgi:phosphoesterase RecJ-like protein